jgi:error-prone DNA polymerase
VRVIGLVIRRQRPSTKSGVVFLTLEDETGHLPLMIWPKTYDKYREALRSALVTIVGAVSRRDGTMNVVVHKVEKSSEMANAPKSKDWG